MKKNHLLDYLFLVVVALLGIWLRGYSFGKGDQVLHLPLLNQLEDSYLYNADYIFPLILTHRTIIYDLILTLKKLLTTDVFIVYLFVYLLGQIGFYIAIYRLSMSLFEKRSIALLSCLAFLIPIPVGGAAIETIETGFVLRELSTVSLLLSLDFLLRNKLYLCIFFLLLLWIIHPLSGVIYLPIVLGLIFFLFGFKSFKYVLICVVGVVVLILFSSGISHQLKSIPIFPTKEWIDILQFRVPYAFPILWPLKSWIYLGLLLTPFFFVLCSKIVKKDLSPLAKKSIIWFLSISFLILAIQYIFTTVLPISYIIFLQLGRVWLIPIILSLLISISFLAKKTHIALLPIHYLKAIIMFGLLVPILYLGKPIINGQNSKWIEAQKWIKSHTSINCTIAVDFYSQGFRVFSERAITGEFKDGTLALYSPEFAKNWNDRRLAYTNNKFEINSQNLVSLQEKYMFSLAVLSNRSLTIPKLLYTNDSFYIYEMPKKETSCLINI